MSFASSLGMGKIGLKGGMGMGMNKCCCNMILTTQNCARRNVAFLDLFQIVFMLNWGTKAPKIHDVWSLVVGEIHILGGVVWGLKLGI